MSECKDEEKKIIFKGIKYNPEIILHAEIVLSCYQFKKMMIRLEQHILSQSLKIHAVADYQKFYKEANVKMLTGSLEELTSSKATSSYSYQGEFDYPYEWEAQYLDKIRDNLKNGENIDKEFVKKMFASLVSYLFDVSPLIMPIIAGLPDYFNTDFDKLNVEVQNAQEVKQSKTS